MLFRYPINLFELEVNSGSVLLGAFVSIWLYESWNFGLVTHSGRMWVLSMHICSKDSSVPTKYCHLTLEHHTELSHGFLLFTETPVQNQVLQWTFQPGLCWRRMVTAGIPYLLSLPCCSHSLCRLWARPQLSPVLFIYWGGGALQILAPKQWVCFWSVHKQHL